MADATIIIGAVEVAKLILQGLFSYLRISGLTPEEIDAFITDQKKYFDEHPPETLPDV